MSSFFNLVLDTTAPQSLSLKINDGAQYTTSTEVTLSISVTDEVTTNYQMKIWGIASAEDEGSASWETFANSKTVNLSSGDGAKTVYIKVRDDVYNETSAVSAQIILNTVVPTVTIVGPDVAKISKVSGKNVSSFTFTSNVTIIAWKVLVVKTSDALHDAGTNVQIPDDGGSVNMQGNETKTTGDSISCTIYGADLETASSGDGTKIVKVFVQNEAGTWSVA